MKGLEHVLYARRCATRAQLLAPRVQKAACMYTNTTRTCSAWIQHPFRGVVLSLYDMERLRPDVGAHKELRDDTCTYVRLLNRVPACEECRVSDERDLCDLCQAERRLRDIAPERWRFPSFVSRYATMSLPPE